MTREQAEELVWDLLQSHSDNLLGHYKGIYAADFEALRERVVSHMITRETSKGWWDWSALGGRDSEDR